MCDDYYNTKQAIYQGKRKIIHSPYYWNASVPLIRGIFVIQALS